MSIVYHTDIVEGFNGPVSTVEKPLLFFEWLFEKDGYEKFANDFRPPQSNHKRGSIQNFIECEAILSSYLFIESLPNQTKTEKKQRKVTQFYFDLNSLYVSAKGLTVSDKLLKCFGKIHWILKQKYSGYIKQSNIQFPELDIEYRHVFQDEFLIQLMDLPLHDNYNKGYKIFEQKVTANEFRKVLLGEEFKLKKKAPIIVQWDEKAFSFMMLKFVEQHAIINFQNLSTIFKYKDDNRSFSFENFRTFCSRQKISKKSLFKDKQELYKKDFDDYKFMKIINDFFDVYMDNMDAHM